MLSLVSWLELLEVLIGRRGGKSRAMALLCVYLATLCDWSNDLSLGERGLALFLAPSERQALNAFRYAEAVIDDSPLLAGLVTSRTQDTLTPARGIDIEVQCANWRRTRGST